MNVFDFITITSVILIIGGIIGLSLVFAVEGMDKTKKYFKYEIGLLKKFVLRTIFRDEKK